MSIHEHNFGIKDGVASGSAEYCSACITRIDFSTNGPQGGDGGHGGFTEITLSNVAGTGMSVSTDDGPLRAADRLVIRFEGDCEMEAAAELFSHLGEELRRSLKLLSSR